MLDRQASSPAPGSLAAQNDAFRRALREAAACGIGGRVVLTCGIEARGAAFVFQALKAVRDFDAFNADCDPYGERDFGAVEVEGAKLFWKIDLYDADYAYGSAAPQDPAVTRRVLTVMLADEW
jgi:hypothetical protein